MGVGYSDRVDHQASSSDARERAAFHRGAWAARGGEEKQRKMTSSHRLVMGICLFFSYSHLNYTDGIIMFKEKHYHTPLCFAERVMCAYRTGTGKQLPKY